MSKKRMFNLSVLETDAFMDLPLSAQALYFHLNLRADDDGLVGNPKRVTMNIGASLDDLKLLIAKRFLLAFDSGIVAIKHWRMHNVIKKDRYSPTNFIEEFEMLRLKENGSYTFQDNNVPQLENTWSANGAQMLQTSSVGKVRLDKDRLDKDNKKPQKHRYGEYEHVLLTFEEFEKLRDIYGEPMVYKYIKELDEGIEMKGYKYKSHYLAMRKWIERDLEREEEKAQKEKPKDELPVYDASNNPEFNEDRFNELMRGRNAN